MSAKSLMKMNNADMIIDALKRGADKALPLAEIRKLIRGCDRYGIYPVIRWIVLYSIHRYNLSKYDLAPYHVYSWCGGINDTVLCEGLTDVLRSRYSFNLNLDEIDGPENE